MQELNRGMVLIEQAEITQTEIMQIEITMIIILDRIEKVEEV